MSSLNKSVSVTQNRDQKRYKVLCAAIPTLVCPQSTKTPLFGCGRIRGSGSRGSGWRDTLVTVSRSSSSGKMCESERGSRHWICTCATHTPLWACTICFVVCQKGFLIRVKNDTMLTWCPAMHAGGGGATHRGSGRQNRGCPVCSLFHVEHGRERECWFARVPGGFGVAAWPSWKARGTRCATARAGDGAATQRWAGRQIPGRVGAQTRRGDQGGSDRAGRTELWARWGPQKPPDPCPL